MKELFIFAVIALASGLAFAFGQRRDENEKAADMDSPKQSDFPMALPDWKQTLSRMIARWGFLSGLDPSLIYGVVMTESSGNPAARNPSDPSAGLMQVTPLIGRFYGGLSGNDAAVLEALLDPEANMRAGTGFLRHLRERYGPEHLPEVWIQAYNLGETQFDKGARVPEYGKRVMRFAAQWRGET